jgi:hypothetical protein
MELPGEVDAAHAYRAFRAVLRLLARHADRVTDVYCPGLASGTGRVAAAQVASEMRKAWDDTHAAGMR